MGEISQQEFVFPLKGKDENWRVSSQPPMSSPLISNVRPYGSVENRARGGSRPGLSRVYATSVGLAGNYGADLYGAGTYGGQTASSPIVALVTITTIN